MRKMKRIAWILPLLLPLAQPAWSNDDLVSSQMADEARTWQQKDRADLAAGIWRKLLRANPRHPEALVNLGMIEARRGNRTEADALYKRARALPRAPAELQQLAAVLGKVTVKESAPRTAAAPAGQSGPAAATAALRGAPSRVVSVQKSAVARQALTPRTEDWRQRRQRLEELARNQPNDHRHLLTLAQHLATREATRPEAIRLFEHLWTLGFRPEQTRSAWRSALLALDASDTDGVALSNYLQFFPNDTTLAARVRGAERRSVVDGRGLVVGSNSTSRMAAVPQPAPMTGNQSRAASLLQRALQDEQGAAHGAAANKLEQALLMDPANPSIRAVLARQYLYMGALPAAAGLINDVLTSTPGLPEALHVRATLLAAQQRWSESLATLEQIPAAVRTPQVIAEQRRIWVSAQVHRARLLHQRDAGEQASGYMQQIEYAVRDDDRVAGIIAAGWAELGDVQRGLHLMRGVLSRTPNPPLETRIRYAEMLLYAFQDTELAALLRDLAATGRMNPVQRDELNAIIVGYTLRVAEGARESGRLADARASLTPLLQRSDDPSVLASMARLLRASGDYRSALDLTENAIERDPGGLDLRLLAAELALAGDAPARAAQHTNAALNMAPAHPRSLGAAARLQRVQGNLAQAQEYASSALSAERDPAAFGGVPRHLQLRLVERGQTRLALPATISPFRPAAPGTDGGLLPIPMAPQPAQTIMPAPGSFSVPPIPGTPSAPAAPTAPLPVAGNTARIGNSGWRPILPAPLASNRAPQTPILAATSAIAAAADVTAAPVAAFASPAAIARAPVAPAAPAVAIPAAVAPPPARILPPVPPASAVRQAGAPQPEDRLLNQQVVYHGLYGPAPVSAFPYRASRLLLDPAVQAALTRPENRHAIPSKQVESGLKLKLSVTLTLPVSDQYSGHAI